MAFNPPCPPPPPGTIRHVQFGAEKFHFNLLLVFKLRINPKQLERITFNRTWIGLNELEWRRSERTDPTLVNAFNGFNLSWPLLQMN